MRILRISKRYISFVLAVLLLLQLIPVLAGADPLLTFSGDGGEKTISIEKSTEEEQSDYSLGQLRIECKHISLRRDYNQSLLVSITNESNNALTYYLSVDNEYRDIYLNFVEDGCEAAPLTINSGENQTVKLNCFLQDAQEAHYSLPVKAFVKNEENGAYFESAQKTIGFDCLQPQWDVTIEKSAEKGDKQTFTIKNHGERITDLSVTVDDTIKKYCIFSPSIDHAIIDNSESLDFSVTPNYSNIIEDGISKIAGNLVVSAGSAKWTKAIEFEDVSDTNSIEAWRLGLYQRNNHLYNAKIGTTKTSVSEEKLEENGKILADEITEENVEKVLEALGYDKSKKTISNEISTSINNAGKLYNISSAVTLSPRTSATQNINNNTAFEGLNVKVNNDGDVFQVAVTADTEASDTLKSISDALSDIANVFNIEKDIERVVEYGVNLFEEDYDAGGRIAVIMKFPTELIKLANSDNQAIMHIFDVLDGANKYVSSAAKVLDIASIMAEPNLGYNDKVGLGALSIAEALTKLANRTGLAGLPFTKSWSVGFDLIGRLEGIENGVGKLSSLSNEELGEYLMQTHTGSQCTNAGRVETIFDTEGGLSRGMLGISADFEIAKRLKSGEIEGRDLLPGYGDNYRLRSSSSRGNPTLTIKAPTVEAGEDDTSFVVCTGRIYSPSTDYYFREKTNQSFYVNGSDIGSTTINGLSDVYMVGLLTNKFKSGSNTITRQYDTNPGSYSVCTDTEVNIAISPNAQLYYKDLDSLPTILPLPDFAIYPESIYFDENCFLNEDTNVSFKVYNRGARGGWTDISVLSNGKQVYEQENVFVPAFASTAISIPDFKVSSLSTKIEVVLENKTVDVNETKKENNQASVTITAKKIVVPEIKGVTPLKIITNDYKSGALCTLDLEKDENVKEINYSWDEEAYSNTIKGSERELWIPSDYLSEGLHRLTIAITYQAGSKSTDIISKNVDIDVEIDEGICFDSVLDNPLQVYLLEESDNRFVEVDGKLYDLSVSNNKNNKDSSYEYALYLEGSYNNHNNYVVLLCSDDYINIVPLSSLNGSTVSLDNTVKCSIEYDKNTISDVYTRITKINGKGIPVNLSLATSFYVGKDIDNLSLSSNYLCSGYYFYDKSNKLSIADGETTAFLNDTRTHIRFINSSGTVRNPEMIIRNDNGSSSIDLNYEAEEGSSGSVFWDENIKDDISDSDKAVLVLNDDEALYIVNAKDDLPNTIDLKKLRDSYCRISYTNMSSVKESTLYCEDLLNYHFGFSNDEIMVPKGNYTVDTLYYKDDTLFNYKQVVVVDDKDVVLSLPEGIVSNTTVQFSWPDSFNSVKLSYYDTLSGTYIADFPVEKGLKINASEGEQYYSFSVVLPDNSYAYLEKLVNVEVDSNTRVELSNQFVGTLDITGKEGGDDIEIQGNETVTMSFDNIKDKNGARLTWFSSNTELQPTLVLTKKGIVPEKYEIKADETIWYINGDENTYSFRLPNEEGLYSYQLEMRLPDSNHVHSLMHVDKKNATCENDGNIDYYLCEECGKAFEDCDGVNEIDKQTITIHALGHAWGDWLTVVEASEAEDGLEKRVCQNDNTHSETRPIPKTNHQHTLIKVEGKEATIEEDGNISHFRCEKCDKLFEDEDGLVELNPEDVVIPKQTTVHNHLVTKVTAVSATCTEPGNIQYYICSICGKVFEDENCEQELDLSNVSTSPIGHDWGEWVVKEDENNPGQFVRVRTCNNDATHIERESVLIPDEEDEVLYSFASGLPLHWHKNSRSALATLIIRTPVTEALRELFRGVSLDGNAVDKQDYKVFETDNRLSVQLLPSILQSLSVGNHELGLQFDDGFLRTNICIEEANNNSIPEVKDPTDPTDISEDKDSSIVTLNGIVKGPDGKWAMYKDGKVDTSFTSIAKNQYGWWRVKDGYVDFDAQGIYQNQYGWWKTTDGKVTFNETGVFQNDYGWWRVKDSKVDFKAQSIYQNQYGWWKTTNGKVTFNETGVFRNKYGWWRVKNSKVDFKAHGIYQNQYGWWKTTDGKVTFKENGVFQNQFGWWKVKDSKVDFSFNGIASNKYGKWYVKNGKIDFSKNGKVIINGTIYRIKNGKVQ